jgi:cytochrome c oxidase cbb3-type subunit 3
MISNRSWYTTALILTLVILWTAPLALAQFGPPPAIPTKPHPKATAESIAAGKEIFTGTCANCHGIDGSGANGPNIQSMAATLGPEGLYSTIHNGVPGSGMPSFGMLGDDKLWQIVDYVSSLGHEGPSVATGDPQKGKEVYASSGCAKCHVIDGEGGDLGPELTRIGAVRAVATLQKTLEDPGQNLPIDTALQERANYQAYEIYRVTTKDGHTFEGMRVDDDSFTMQLKDANGRLHSVQKYGGDKIEPEPGKSFMPSYKGKLSETQMNDLVAYLASLGGAQ